MYNEMTKKLNQEKLSKLEREGKLAFSQIKSMASLGEKEVFDITVDREDGLFLVNNLVVHNCKESRSTRGYTQVNVKEKNHELEVTYNGKSIKVPSKAKVKFWDNKANIMMFGPLEVAIANDFPIEKRSLQLLVEGKLERFIGD